jgi:hypothetical protein
MSSYITTGSARKLAANLIHHSNRPQIDYAVQRIALRARISVAQASVIAELIGLSAEVGS